MAISDLKMTCDYLVWPFFLMSDIEFTAIRALESNIFAWIRLGIVFKLIHSWL